MLFQLRRRNLDSNFMMRNMYGDLFTCCSGKTDWVLFHAFHLCEDWNRTYVFSSTVWSSLFALRRQPSCSDYPNGPSTSLSSSSISLWLFQNQDHGHRYDRSTDLPGVLIFSLPEVLLFRLRAWVILRFISVSWGSSSCLFDDFISFFENIPNW